MLKHKIVVLSTSIVIFLSALVETANAATVPTFPACANPQGEVISSYETGTHGVPGDKTTYTGKDTVYRLSDEAITQCLCPANGNGVQTNWWRIPQLSQTEIDILVSEGWVYIPDGSAWGLSEGPYLAKNSSFSCNGGSGGTSSTGGTSQTAGASATQAILALASTGNIKFILGIFLTGTALIATGAALNFKKRS